jgi:hypothetical protein
VWFQAVNGVVSAIGFSVVLGEFLDVWRELVERPAGSTAPEPVPSIPPGFYAIQLLSLLQLGGLVVWVIWQHRANTTSQALRLPLTRSPGLGVGGWFIPIVNLWFPYEATRDNLPLGHPSRPVVLHWWLGFLAQGFLLWAVAGAWVVGGPFVGLVASSAHVAFAVWWVTRAEHVLTSIGQEHRRLAGMAG